MLVVLSEALAHREWPPPHWSVSAARGRSGRLGASGRFMSRGLTSLQGAARCGDVGDTADPAGASNRIAEGDWAGTYRVLAARGAEELEIDELDRLAVAAYLTGREDESFRLWERGHQRCAATGDAARSARFGVRLAQALAFKGDLARTVAGS